jgi:PBP1b-binding outer membrane lipoprotein LpoB
MKRLLAITPLLLVLAGCGASTQPSSVDEFQGEERAVAQKVEDLQTAGEQREPETICSDILARALVTQLEAAGANCTQEMEKAIEDADDYALDVEKVEVDGSMATVTVKRGEDGPTETMEFTQEGGQWRATSLSGT